MPDAATLFRKAKVDPSALEAEAADLRRRRDDLANLIADGLLAGPAARDRLGEIAERLAVLEEERAPLVADVALLGDPESTWLGWTVPQRRELLRLLFSEISLTHVGNRHGPVADPTRIRLEWQGE